MYIFTLVDDVRKVVEVLRERYGEYKLAMLYNSDFDADTNWNFMVSAPWTDRMGRPEAIRVIARALHDVLGFENKSAISRITVLKTIDPFVRDMTRLYPVRGPGGGVPISQVTAGDVTEGGGFVFYSLPG